MCNVLYVNKPVGISSFDVCFRLRKILGTKKIGHTGTLDPNATGVMIVLFDKATKANQFLVSDKKEYVARVLLGVRTDTLDIDGRIVEERECRLPEKEKIEMILGSFAGESMQEVPLTSAVSVNGKRLYRYQLEGKEVELPVRKIEVFDIGLTQMHDDGFSFRCIVSSGTYIRALVRDILTKMDLIGTLSALERTAIDDVRLEECDALDEIIKGNYHKHDIYDLLKKRYEVCEDFEESDVCNGKKLKIASNASKLLMAKHGKAFAIYERDGDVYRCLRGLW
jgi:tRNA pseudouridine55 synthase